MRSYVYAALKLSVAEYEGDVGKFTSLIKEIVDFGAQQRGDRAKFVDEVVQATGQSPATVGRWLDGTFVPPAALRKGCLQQAFDRILARRP